MNRINRALLIGSICAGITVKAGLSAAQEAATDLRISNPTDEVVSQYKMLSKQRHEKVYDDLSVSMRQDLWSLHLSRALVELPELTVEQRAVILRGMGLISRGLLGSDPSDPEWEARFGESLRYLERQAQELLPRDIALNVFSSLGMHVDMSGAAPATCNGSPEQWAEETLEKNIPNCSCSRISDWCANRCSPAVCMPVNGCGTFWQYTCDGKCS